MSPDGNLGTRTELWTRTMSNVCRCGCSWHTLAGQISPWVPEGVRLHPCPQGSSGMRCSQAVTNSTRCPQKPVRDKLQISEQVFSQSNRAYCTYRSPRRRNSYQRAPPSSVRSRSDCHLSVVHHFKFTGTILIFASRYQEPAQNPKNAARDAPGLKKEPEFLGLGSLWLCPARARGLRPAVSLPAAPHGVTAILPVCLDSELL